MRRRNRLLRTMIVAFIFALIAAACGGGDDADPQVESATEEATGSESDSDSPAEADEGDDEEQPAVTVAEDQSRVKSPDPPLMMTSALPLASPAQRGSVVRREVVKLVPDVTSKISS